VSSQFVYASVKRISAQTTFMISRKCGNRGDSVNRAVSPCRVSQEQNSVLHPI